VHLLHDQGHRLLVGVGDGDIEDGLRLLLQEFVYRCNHIRFLFIVTLFIDVIHRCHS
jgi:hypothetical protein